MNRRFMYGLILAPILLMLTIPAISGATGQTLYGLSGLPLSYYAFVLGPSSSSTFFGMHFWEAPYRGPQSNYAHMYFSAPGGISVSVINRIEVAFCASMAFKRVNKFYVNAPMLDNHALSEMGLGDWRFSAKGLIIKQDKAKVDLGVVFFMDLPMGRGDRTRLNTNIGDDQLNRRALTQLTDSESRFGGTGVKNYNWGIIEAITRGWYPEGDYKGYYNKFVLTGNIGYVIRTGTINYADDISLYKIDQNFPLDFDYLNGHILTSKRADYFLFGGGVEVTPIRSLSCIFDNQIRMYQGVPSDSVLNPNRNSARTFEMLAAVRINHFGLYHLTLGFGKTFGKWSVNYSTGTLTNQNYNIYVTVGTDLPTKELDTDRDGVPDAKDLAPRDPEDKDGFQDWDGVPDPDNDNDGIPDINDGAPNDPEDIDGWEDTDGVPDPDNDGDGIPDIRDAAPNDPEDFEGYEDEDGKPEGGSPVKKPEVKRMTLRGLNFKPNTAELLPGSYPSLDEAAKILKDFPDVTVTIEGHAANVGRPDDELMVSQLRAETIKNILASRYGIDSSRIKTIGYGSTVPIADNSTESGRSMNRRIEFVVNE
jgi:outer membrane protein OmpA-like peptidoglycan-associated protein